MPNDQDTEADELQIEVIAEDKSVEDTQTTENSEGESEDTKVNLETETPKVDKPSPAVEQAQRQEDAWASKILAGKGKVEDAPQWLQKRLNTRLEAMGEAPQTEEVIEKILAKKEEDREFKALEATIPPLTKSQAEELTKRYNSLKSSGKVVALQATLDAMGLSHKIKEAEQRGVAKGRTSLPKPGQSVVRKSEQANVGGVPMNIIQSEKEWNEMIRQGKDAESRQSA